MADQGDGADWAGVNRNLVIASEAKQSSFSAHEAWIASSPFGRLAMTAISE
jgi:hypothetical protein